MRFLLDAGRGVWRPIPVMGLLPGDRVVDLHHRDTYPGYYPIWVVTEVPTPGGGHLKMTIVDWDKDGK